MSAAPELLLSPAVEGHTLVLRGALRRDSVRPLLKILAKTDLHKGRTLFLDLSAVSALDSAIVATLIRAWRQAQATGGRVALSMASPEAERALAMFRVNEAPEAPAKPLGFFETLGDGTYAGRAAVVDFLQLAADTTFAFFGALRHRTLRWGAIVEQSMDIGSRALGIVGLITFLVGLTVAFQSAYQLQQFGAAIYVANLTGVSMVREMGPLMCAILVAGRSGSSIAAEIATMQVSEEVDALTVLGMNPVDYLALPKLIAIVLMVPLLTVMADLLGIMGGLLVGIFYLDIAPTAFVNQMLGSMSVWDFASGLIKSFVFAWGIGLIGLYYGFRVRGGASEVGRTTTASVVASIFYIIIADCVFSVLFYVLV